MGAGVTDAYYRPSRRTTAMRCLPTSNGSARPGAESLALSTGQPARSPCHNTPCRSSLASDEGAGAASARPARGQGSFGQTLVEKPGHEALGDYVSALHLLG